LANSNKYQSLLNAREDICDVKFFNNNNNFSKLQLRFISWLQFYKFLRSEISTEELSDIVLKDDIYADSYYFWRSTKYSEYIQKKYEKPEKEENPHALKVTHRRRK